MNTIKILFSSLLLLAASTTVFSQDNKFEIGTETGPSIIFLRGSDVFRDYGRATVGYSAALTFQYNISKIFSLRTNIAYERKGTVLHYSTSLNNDDIKTRMHYNYLTLPVLLRATFGSGKIKYFANAGPFLGYLLKQTFVTKYEDEKTTVDNTDRHEHFDIGITTGVGLLSQLNEKVTLSFEARNNLGLTNVSAEEFTDGGTIKTNSTNLLLGIAYKFGTGKSDAK